MIYDVNRSLIRNYDRLLSICGGDEEKALQIYRILKNSHRNEKEQSVRPLRYQLIFIDGELTRLKV